MLVTATPPGKSTLLCHNTTNKTHGPQQDTHHTHLFAMHSTVASGPLQLSYDATGAVVSPYMHGTSTAAASGSACSTPKPGTHVFQHTRAYCTPPAATDHSCCFCCSALSRASAAAASCSLLRAASSALGLAAAAAAGRPPLLLLPAAAPTCLPLLDAAALHSMPHAAVSAAKK